ncbi:MAG: hypothetical protein HGB03_03840 [Candidatus Yonathbacteria bacterium]|nr:hypothetical protein [Candidatus Yonathbacteria bacterium]NTW47637.1 hypothetical protein [Candidatus Yonathbacteria bacterium]
MIPKRTYTEEELSARFEAMPNDIKAVLASADIGHALERIGQRNSLHLDQIGELSIRTTLVMLGLEPRAGYAQTLMDTLGITEEHARLIIEDINREIFNPVRTSLEQIHHTESESRYTKEQADDEEINMPSREELLKEIEQPSKTQQIMSTSASPIKNEDPVPVHVIHETPSATSEEGVSLPPSVLKPGEDTTSDLPMIPPETDVAITPTTLPSILEQKLSHTVSIPPTQQTEKERPVFPPKPTNDPYRESFTS